MVKSGFTDKIFKESSNPFEADKITIIAFEADEVAVIDYDHLFEQPFAATSEVTNKDINPFKDEDTE